MKLDVVWADKKPFIATSDFVEASYYDQNFGPIKFKGKKKDGTLRKIYMESRDADKIQDQAAKLLKITATVPFRVISELIIEEIND